MLRWRALTAAIAAPVAIGAILLGKWAILALVLLIVARAAQELARALENVPFMAALAAGALPVVLSIPFGASGILAGAVFSLPWTLFWVGGSPKTRTLRAVLALLLMTLWVGVPMAHLELIGVLEGGDRTGTYLVLIAVVGPWLSDAGAYFAGRFFGRHLLAPSLSPKKTVEGAIGGIIATTAVVAPFAHVFLGLDLVSAAVAGAVISILSQAGDLFESILKRLLNLKDLGRALPGHGGILDRIDSLLFTAPGVYYLYILLPT